MFMFIQNVEWMMLVNSYGYELCEKDVLVESTLFWFGISSKDIGLNPLKMVELKTGITVIPGGLTSHL